MPTCKPLDKIAAKWTRVCQTAGESYSDGVRNPRRDWSDATTKAANSYAAGVQAAVSSGRFAKGVTAAGTAKWQANSLAKGPARWSEGVRLGQDAYERGFAPFRQIIEGINLPARGPVGSPGNIERVKIIADKLHAAKLARVGG